LVRTFTLADDPVYIASLPAWGMTIRYDPHFYPDFEERQRRRQQLAEWEAAGSDQRGLFGWAKGGRYCPCHPNALPLSLKLGPRHKTLRFIRVQRESDATQTQPQCLCE